MTRSRLLELRQLCAGRIKRGEDPFASGNSGYVVPGLRHNIAKSPIPLAFGSVDDYLRTMQTHIDAEYAAGLRKGGEDCVRSPHGGWKQWRLLSQQGRESVVAVLQAEAWLEEPWVLHAIEVEGLARQCLGLTSGTAQSKDPPCPDAVRPLLREGEGYLILRGPEMMTQACGRLRSLGFVGSYMLAYESAQLLRVGLQAGNLTPEHLALLNQVAAPGSPGRSLRLDRSRLLSPQLVDSLPPDTANASQREAIRSVQDGLSIIHGPPGTGKSTTILYLIQARTPPSAKVLVTCTRNQAINAVAEKLASVEGGIIAFGNERCLREAAKRYTLSRRVEADPCIMLVDASIREWESKSEQARDSRRAMSEHGLRSWVASWGAQARKHIKRHRLLFVSAGGLKTINDLMDSLCKGVMTFGDQAAWLDSRVALLTHCKHDMLVPVRRRILREARVYICTIDSTPRLMRELEEEQSGAAVTTSVVVGARPSVEIDTVIVDEAGCVLESAMPVLLRWAPANLVLIGDHLQLAPYTSRDQYQQAGARNDARSLMQRAVEAGCEAPMLDTQYRMHTTICQPVSQLFYGGRVLTGPGISAKRSSFGFSCGEGGAARWLDCRGPEVALEGAGYKNPSEAELVVKTLGRLFEGTRKGEQREGMTVFIITFYNAQRRELESRLEKRFGDKWSERVTLVTVDSVQGSEADVVILSPVRSQSKHQHLGAFMRDIRRLCVAFSRARELSLVVGNAAEMSAKGGAVWKALVTAYTRVERV